VWYPINPKKGNGIRRQIVAKGDERDPGTYVFTGTVWKRNMNKIGHGRHKRQIVGPVVADDGTVIRNARNDFSPEEFLGVWTRVPSEDST